MNNVIYRLKTFLHSTDMTNKKKAHLRCVKTTNSLPVLQGGRRRSAKDSAKMIDIQHLPQTPTTNDIQVVLSIKHETSGSTNEQLGFGIPGVSKYAA